jgi:hypothetical protein
MLKYIGGRARRILKTRIAAPLVTPLASGFRGKRISAMMRVKNEEAFLQASFFAGIICRHQ